MKSTSKKTAFAPSATTTYRSPAATLGLHVERMDSEDYDIRGYTFSEDQDDEFDVEEAKPYDEFSHRRKDPPAPSPSANNNNVIRPRRLNDAYEDYEINDDDQEAGNDIFEAAFPEPGAQEEEEEEAPTINSGISSHVSWFALGGAGLAGQQSQPPPPPHSPPSPPPSQQQRGLQSSSSSSSPTRSGRGGHVHFVDSNKEQEPSLAGTQSTESTNKLMRKQWREAKALEKHQKAVSDALARRSFHLPKNTKGQDWIQYIRNTHPLLAAIGFADKRNKVHGCGYRIIVLLTSIIVGFTAVNAAVWWSKQLDSNTTAVGNNNVSSFFSETLKIDDLTSLPMISLFTWMALVHAIHDIVAWYGCVAAYTRNIDDGFKGLMFGLLWMFFWAGAATTFTALLFTTTTTTTNEDVSDLAIDSSPEYDHLTDRQQNDYIQQHGGASVASESSYDYVTILIYLGIEIGIAWIIWFPLVVTTCFSGLLGCGGCIPILGGRPRDIQIEKEKAFKASGGVAATLESLADYDESTMDIRPNQKARKESRFM